MTIVNKTVLGALAACACVLVALTLHGLRDDPSPPSTARSAASATAVPSHELAPWQATAETAGAPLPGTLPVSSIDPPKPDPAMPLPPAQVIEPPNPALHRPSLDNPGGVDGKRPPRAVDGLD